MADQYYFMDSTLLEDPPPHRGIHISLLQKTFPDISWEEERGNLPHEAEEPYRSLNEPEIS